MTYCCQRSAESLYRLYQSQHLQLAKKYLQGDTAVLMNVTDPEQGSADGRRHETDQINMGMLKTKEQHIQPKGNA